MEPISLTRKTLYEQIWTESVAAFCLKYDVPEEGVEEICRRLNVLCQTTYWRRLSKENGRLDVITDLPTESRGTETVVLYKRNGTLHKEEHMKMISAVLQQAGGSSVNLKLDEKVFDKLIHSTKEGHVQALGRSTHL